MLRRSITWLRSRGLSSFLPLDQHVYLHKICAAFIIFFTILHTVAHVVNIGMAYLTKFKVSLNLVLF